MNVPAVAKKTFDELRQRPEYVAIIEFVLARLLKIPNGLQRARIIHKMVDEYNSEVFAHPLVKEYSPCKMGCTACCHTQVSVTEEEAQLLAHQVENGVVISQDRLLKQAQAGNSDIDFLKLKYEDRKCIFLNDQGGCNVYEDRPSVCRTNAVIGSPSQCDTSQKLQPVRLIKTPKSDMVIYASYLHTKSSGSLAFMMSKAIKTSH